MCVLFQDQSTRTDVFKKWLQHMEYPEELHWNGKNAVHVLRISVSLHTDFDDALTSAGYYEGGIFGF